MIFRCDYESLGVGFSIDGRGDGLGRAEEKKNKQFFYFVFLNLCFNVF